MVDSICLFEGIYYSRLLPLVYFRPTYDLRCGILTLREKVIHYFPKTPISLHCRSYLADLVKQQNPNLSVNEIKGKSCLFINGRVIVDSKLASHVSTDIDTLFVKGETIVAARVSGSKLEQLKNKLNDLYTFSNFNELLKKEVDVKIIYSIGSKTKSRITALMAPTIPVAGEATLPIIPAIISSFIFGVRSLK